MNHVATRKVSVRRFKLTNSLDDDERWQQIANKAKAIAAKRRTQNRSTQNPILGGEKTNKQDAKTTSIPQTPSYAKDGRPPSSFFAPDHTPFISKLEPVLLDIENETPLATHSNVITALDTPYASSTQAQINLLKNLPPTTLEWSPSLETPLAKNQCVYPLTNPTLDTPSLRKHSEILTSPKWAAADGNSSLPNQPCLDLPINDDISAFNTTGTIHIDRVTKTRSSNLDGSSNEPPNSTAVGFTTSNGMAIYPSKDSLQRAKHLLDDDNAEDGSMTISRGSWSDKTLKGLSKLALTRPRKFLKNAAGTKFIDGRNQDSSQHQSMENSLASIGSARHPLPTTPIDKEQQHIRSMTSSHEYADSASTTSELTTSNTIVAPASGFLMASGKLPPPLTDEAVSRARNLFDNIMNNTDDHISFESGYKQVEGSFKGLSNLDYLAVVDLNRSTIGNSNYLSDDKATRNHTNLQRDHDSTTAFHLASTTIVPDSTHNQPSLQIVEQESLQKIYTSHAVDKDNTGPAESSTDTSEEFNEGTSTIYQNQSHQEFVGFKSASGKQLPYVSEAAINRGKSLVEFGDVPLEPLEVQPADSTTQTIDVIQRPEVCHVPPVISFCGFKTAGGKPPPKLSDDAIKRGQALMESVAQEFSVDHKFGMSSQAEFVSEPRAMKPASKIACDFVPNSDGNSLLPNANMHEEGVAFFKTDENVGFRHNASSADWVDSDDSAKLGSAVGASRQRHLSGFSTAGGKPPPEISAAALSKARSLMKSVEDAAREDGLFGEPAFPIENLGCSAKTNVQSSFSGFATASGKAPPTISAASLRRATKFFQSEDSSSVDLMEFDSSVPTADSLKIDSNSNTQPKSPKALQLFKKPQNVFKVPMQISRVSQNPVTPKIAAPVARQYQTPTSLTSSTTTTPSSFKTPQHLSGRKASRSHRKPFKTPFSAKKQHTVEVKASTSTKTVVIKNPMFNLSAKHERIKLSEEFRTFIKGKPAQEDSPVGVPEVNSTSAIHYEFVLPTETSSTATWSATEAYAELIESGALPTSIDERWVLNHYRWIVWKLASYLKLNPTKYKELWTPDHVMQQLKYRYEREINQGHRSALKLVIERDGVPSRYMVLCVSDIVEVPRSSSSHTSFHLELTDGWYKIRATMDSSVERAVKTRRIFIGQKLAIFNAQLIGGSDAVPALDVPDSTVLKITGNSTRRARWHAKLGFQKEKFFEVSLNSLMPDGGAAPAVDVVVMRVYPILYMETSPSGRKITRSAQEEENAAAAYEADIEAELQKLLVSYQTTGDMKRSNDRISKGRVRLVIKV
ncbi:hypothetical protein BKA69DRAFT_322256 [Paraphysoderma sedebokerense]|nr:hypothetical protein BKA69DRAFT_322256 [Paraphysoderma sedebokerense]